MRDLIDAVKAAKTVEPEEAKKKARVVDSLKRRLDQVTIQQLGTQCKKECWSIKRDLTDLEKQRELAEDKHECFKFVQDGLSEFKIFPSELVPKFFRMHVSQDEEE